jgi:Cft2 family RNA processing exonuclease
MDFIFQIIAFIEYIFPENVSVKFFPKVLHNPENSLIFTTFCNSSIPGPSLRKLGPFTIIWGCYTTPLSKYTPPSSYVG